MRYTRLHHHHHHHTVLIPHDPHDPRAVTEGLVTVATVPSFLLHSLPVLRTACFVFFLFCTLLGISPMGNWSRFPQGKPAATESRYPALIHYKSACLVFSGFHNPPNSVTDMDYRIVNVST